MLLVLTLSIFAYSSNWANEGCFGLLDFTTARSKFAIKAAEQLHLTSIKRVLSTYLVDDRVQIGKSLLAALRPSVALRFFLMDIERMICGHPYKLFALTMAQKTIVTRDWSAVSSSSAAQGLSYIFIQGQVFLFPAAGNICVTVHGVQHQVKLSVITAIL